MSETNADTGSRIGEKIRSFRIMRHLTQKQLANDCGLLYVFTPKLVDGELCFTFSKTPETFSDQQVIDRYLWADLLYTWCGIRDLMAEGKIPDSQSYSATAIPLTRPAKYFPTIRLTRSFPSMSPS